MRALRRSCRVSIVKPPKPLWVRALSNRPYWDKYRLCREGLSVRDAIQATLARREMNRQVDKRRRERVRAKKVRDRNARCQLQLVESSPKAVALCVRCRGELCDPHPEGKFLFHTSPALGCHMRILHRQKVKKVLRCIDQPCPRLATTEGRCAFHRGKLATAANG